MAGRVRMTVLNAPATKKALQEEMTRILGQAEGLSLRVGVLEGPRKDKEGDPLDNVGLAIIHEFGAGSVPERSFLRAFYDEHKSTIASNLQKVLKAQVERGGTAQAALERLGFWAVGQIQKRIANKIPPPLKPETAHRKGSDVPLIDTGQLRASIVHVVTKDKLDA